MTLAYLISAAASLYIYSSALFIVYFAIIYYGYYSLAGYVAPILLAPLGVPFVIGCMALVRRLRSKPYLRKHGTISGICGGVTATIGIPTIMVDSDFGLAVLFAITGLLISTPMLIGFLADRKMRS